MQNIISKKVLSFSIIFLLAQESMAALTGYYSLSADKNVATAVIEESAPQTELSSFYDQIRRPEQNSSGLKYKEFYSQTQLLALKCSKSAEANSIIQSRCEFQIKKGSTNYSYSEIFELGWNTARVNLVSKDSDDLDGVFPKNEGGRIFFDVNTHCGYVIPCGAVNLKVRGAPHDHVLFEIQSQ